MSDSHISDKILINSALSYGHAQQNLKDTYKSSAIMLEQRNAELQKKNDALQAENERLKRSGDAALLADLSKLRKESGEKDLVIARQKELLRQWMVSQTAFKNLFKKYGKLPDGRMASDAPKVEVQEIVDAELSKVDKETPKSNSGA